MYVIIKELNMILNIYIDYVVLYVEDEGCMDVCRGLDVVFDG